MISNLMLYPLMKPPSGIGKGRGGVKRNKEKSAAGSVTAPQLTGIALTDENLKVLERNFAETGLLHEGALNYRGTLEERVHFYEGVDRVLKRLPEGYGWQFRNETIRNNGNPYTKPYIQLVLVSKGKKVDRYTGKVKTVRYTSSFLSGGVVYIPEGFSASAIRGYAKAEVYRVAGKIYSQAERGVSSKYPPLDIYGEPKK